jgi:uncharacterized protein (TIGR02996 family)
VVVVQVRAAGTQTWQRHSFEASFWIGSDSSCELVLPHLGPRHARIVLDGPDVHLELAPRCSARLDNDEVDRDFDHVLHVGNVLDVVGSLVAFEIVAGLPADVKRYSSGEGKHLLDDTELSFIDALRSNPDDGEVLDVYADWLDQNERPLLAELIRLQRLRDSPRRPENPSEFQSKWLSAQPAAVALRMRDLAPFAEPWWRALVARQTIVGCSKPYDCPSWQRMRPTEHANQRSCSTCKHSVYFCWSRDDIRDHGRMRNPIAIDPALSVRDPATMHMFPDRGTPADEITGEYLPYDED